MNKRPDDELIIELDDDVESDVDVDAATREALEAVDRVERRDPPAGAASVPPPAETGTDAEALAWREEALRSRADYENLKRRTEKEREETKKYLLTSTFRDLLPIVDNLGRALTATGTISDLKLGVELIHRQLLELLRHNGVRPIEAVGRTFDPSLHEAVARHEDADVAAPTVADELQAGFTIGDRLLRPAMVRVAMPVARPATADENPDSDPDRDSVD